MAANEIEIVMPALGESVVEGEILEWCVAEGEHVDLEAPRLDVSSDKANVELPSPYAGTLVRQLVAVGDMVDVNAPIALLRRDGDTNDNAAEDGGETAQAPPHSDEDHSLFHADDTPETVHNPFADARPACWVDKTSANVEQPRAGTNRYGRVLRSEERRVGEEH